MQTERPRSNPWMNAITVLWLVLAGLAVVLLTLGLQGPATGADGTPSPASACLLASGMAAVAAVVVLAVQLAAGAVRWYLDPAVRDGAGSPSTPWWSDGRA